MPSTFGTHLTDIRAKVKEVVQTACPEIIDGRYLLAAAAQRFDWRTKIQKAQQSADPEEGFKPPFVVVRIGKAVPWPEGPAALVCESVSLDIYYVLGYRNEADGTKYDDDAFRALLDQAAGRLKDAFRPGGHEYFTVMPDIGVDSGDSLDANETFFQYKLPLEAVKVSMTLRWAVP